jgi:hypothetical protein
MKFIFVLCILGASAANCLALDREAFTFTKYDLAVRIEPEQQRLAVRGKITVRNDSASPQKNISLQISSTLKWRSIHIGEKEVQYVTQPFTSDIDHTGELSEAIVTLAQEVPPQSVVELEIGYEGVIPLDAARLTRIDVPKKIAEHSDWDTIGKSFTAVRGIGYVAWYPIATESANLSEGNSVFETVGRWKAKEARAEMKIHLEYSGESDDSTPILLCDANGAGSVVEQMSRSEHATADCSFAPLGIVVPIFAMGEYSFLDRQTMAIFHLSEHQSAAESYALAAELAVPFVTEWFGVPREKIGAIELADAEAAPYENGTLLLTPLASSDSRLYRLNAVHQLTHAAFPSPRPWIYEGLAHFAQALDREQQSGRKAALDYMGSHRTAIADVEKMLSAERNDTNKENDKAADNNALINSSNEELYRSKAMFVWWMLRDMAGEGAFKKALAAYHPEQDKDPAYLQHLLETQSKRDLQWFFDGWVYHDRGLPDFHVQSAYTRPTTGGGYVATVTVENLADVGAEVPITVRIDGGEINKRVEIHAKAKVLIRFDCVSTPQEVVINDGSVPESETSNNTFKIEIPASVR